MPETVTLEFLGEQMRRLLLERQADRADMMTIVAMIQRTEAAVAAIQQQITLLGQQLTTMQSYSRAVGDELRQLRDDLAAKAR